MNECSGCLGAKCQGCGVPSPLLVFDGQFFCPACAHDFLNFMFAEENKVPPLIYRLDLVQGQKEVKL